MLLRFIVQARDHKTVSYPIIYRLRVPELQSSRPKLTLQARSAEHEEPYNGLTWVVLSCRIRSVSLRMMRISLSSSRIRCRSSSDPICARNEHKWRPC